MTLLYGVHTQDGVYLAADTRLTTTIKSSGEIKHEDDFAKYARVGEYMYLIAAGDACFASYLISKIMSSDLKNLPFTDFKNQIFSFIESEVGFYPNIAEANPVVFIFSGPDANKKESVSMDRMTEIAQMMQGNSNQSVPIHLSESLKEAMYQASVNQKTGPLLELNKPLIGLFALEIHASGGLKIKLTDAGWSSYLMYGPKGLTAKDAPPELAVKLDLASRPAGQKRSDAVYDHVLELILFFKKMIPKHELPTVGGTIITLFIDERGGWLPTGETKMAKKSGEILGTINSVIEQDGQLCTEINDEIKPFRSLIGFYRDDSQMDILNI